MYCQSNTEKNYLLKLDGDIYRIPSMYGIFTYIYHENQPNVGKYTIHGWYGIYCTPLVMMCQRFDHSALFFWAEWMDTFRLPNPKPHGWMDRW